MLHFPNPLHFIESKVLSLFFFFSNSLIKIQFTCAKFAIGKWTVQWLSVYWELYHHYYYLFKHFSTPKRNLTQKSTLSLFPPLLDWFCFLSMDFLYLIYHMSEIVKYLIYCDWFPSLSLVFSRVTIVIEFTHPFFCQIIFYHIAIPFFYTFISFEHLVSSHFKLLWITMMWILHTNFCLGICFQFYWLYT